MAKSKEIMSIEEAAVRLGTKPEEIFCVEIHSHGAVVVTTDGTKTLFCDVPDAEGKTGIMFLERPDGRDRDDPKAPPYTMPVFAPKGPREVEELEHIDEPVGVDGDGEHVTEPTEVEKKSK